MWSRLQLQDPDNRVLEDVILKCVSRREAAGTWGLVPSGAGGRGRPGLSERALRPAPALRLALPLPFRLPLPLPLSLRLALARRGLGPAGVAGGRGPRRPAAVSPGERSAPRFASDKGRVPPLESRFGKVSADALGLPRWRPDGGAQRAEPPRPRVRRATRAAGAALLAARPAWLLRAARGHGRGDVGRGDAGRGDARCVRRRRGPVRGTEAPRVLPREGDGGGVGVPPPGLPRGPRPGPPGQTDAWRLSVTTTAVMSQRWNHTVRRNSVAGPSGRMFHD
ncbi:uncharacterized protein [Vulpes vulpes]|uniref:Uncharacterized protein n=1 Tax=Vulpes vulpes TaxID=9627 RepID=A0ABM5AVG9_VULVU